METTKYPSHQLYGHVKEFGDFVWMWICLHDVEICWSGNWLHGHGSSEDDVHQQWWFLINNVQINHRTLKPIMTHHGGWIKRLTSNPSRPHMCSSSGIKKRRLLTPVGKMNEGSGWNSTYSTSEYHSGDPSYQSDSSSPYCWWMWNTTFWRSLMFTLSWTERSRVIVHIHDHSLESEEAFVFTSVFADLVISKPVNSPPETTLQMQIKSTWHRCREVGEAQSEEQGRKTKKKISSSYWQNPVFSFPSWVLTPVLCSRSESLRIRICHSCFLCLCLTCNKKMSIILRANSLASFSTKARVT